MARLARPAHSRPGFTLVEVALAVAVGMAVIAGSIYGYRSVQQSARFSQARSMVGTIQTNIGMDKFRRGSAPPLSAITSNTDGANKPFWPQTSAGQFPADPITNSSAVLTYDSTASNVALAAGDAANAWDNPCFASGYATPAAAPGYGNGGWLYDPNTGAFRLNLTNKAYPDQRPGTW